MYLFATMGNGCDFSGFVEVGCGWLKKSGRRNFAVPLY